MFKNQVKKCCSLKLDRFLDKCIYQDLIFEARQIALSRIMKFKFPNPISRISMCICVGFLFLQIYTYIRIILRVVKGDATWCKVIIHSNCDRRQFSLIHFSLKEATAFVRQGFCNQGASWSSSCGWTEEFYSQHLSQVGVLVTY